MFNRNIINQLLEWARREKRKPLVLRGARQVGKTTAVHLFAKSFDNYVYLNLDQPGQADIFKRNLSPGELLQALFLTQNINPSKGKTLIFIDEIQNSPQAVAMLRHFYEQFPQFYFIAAGSLLEIMVENNLISFPVGRVEYRYLYPLTFDEYLQARGADQAWAYLQALPFPELAHPVVLKLFHNYSLIGGMPEVVANYLESENLVAVQEVMDNLLTAYRDDFHKYAKSPGSIARLRHAINVAPLEAGRRIKFAGFGNSAYRSREMGKALRTLELAMLIYLIYPTTQTRPPGRIDLKKSPKLQFFDTGLLNYRAGLQPYFYQYDDLHSFHRGIIAEHIVYQEIIAGDLHTDRKPVFWVRQKRQSTAEVDYLLPIQQYLIPVEVKAGKSGKLRSLHQFMDAVDHRYAIRLYSGPLRIEHPKTTHGKVFHLLNLPYYLSGKLKQYAEWFLNPEVSAK